MKLCNSNKYNMYTNEKTIITVDIDDFKKYKEETRGEYVDYVDDNVIVARNMENPPTPTG